VNKAAEATPYKSLQEAKSNKPKSIKSGPRSIVPSEHSNKGDIKSRAQEVEEIEDMVEGVRNVTNEIDYGSKDAARAMLAS
jgi:hypothetical protein